jgi:hypothetical protein
MGDISSIKAKYILFNYKEVIFARLIMTADKER